MSKLGTVTLSTGEELIVEQGWYGNGGAAYTAFSPTEGPWCTFTVNLEAYGMIPGKGCVFINHDIVGRPEFDAFYEKYCDEDYGKVPISFGYAKSFEVKVKEEYR